MVQTKSSRRCRRAASGSRPAAATRRPQRWAQSCALCQHKCKRNESWASPGVEGSQGKERVPQIRAVKSAFSKASHASSLTSTRHRTVPFSAARAQASGFLGDASWRRRGMRGERREEKIWLWLSKP